MVYFTLFFLAACSVLLVLIAYYKNKSIGRLEKIIKNKEESYKKLLSQKKSSEVLTGHIAEKFVPFLKSFKHNPRQAQFLGMPIDFIVFGDDDVTFIEVKSGNSKLNQKQKCIKQLILDKKVKWEEIRIK
jgi:predicted Holliday junction resolvase-like endonuclease